MTVKKVFVDAVEFLEANVDKKVRTILPELLQMWEAKRGRSDDAFVYVDGVLVGRFCTYHGRYEPVEAFSVGSDGKLPSKCVAGGKFYSRQISAAKAAEAALVPALLSGELTVEELAEKKAEIDAEKERVEYPEDYKGYETKEQLIQAMQ